MSTLKRYSAKIAGSVAGLALTASAQADQVSLDLGSASTTYAAALMPALGTATLIGLGLIGFIVLRKRRSSFHVMRAEQKAAQDLKRGIEPIKATDEDLEPLKAAA